MTRRDSSLPLYARCDRCGRNAWKVALRRSDTTVRALRDNPRVHKTEAHPTTGLCPSCFADFDQDYAVEHGTTLVKDARGAAAKAKTPITDALLPSRDTTDAHGLRVWKSCGHRAELDVMGDCYTCHTKPSI